VADVEATEQPILVLTFLLLLLLDVGEGLCRLFQPLGLLVQSVADVLLTFFSGGKPGVEASEVYRLLIAHGRWMMSHVWALIACRRIMVASGNKGHASSLEVAGDLLIRLMLVIVKVVVLPYLARSLLPGSLRVMRRGLLLANMARMMHQGRSCFVETYIIGVGQAFQSGVFTTIPRVRVTSDSCGGTPTWSFLLLQIKDRNIHRIQTELSVG
jgi:hypothetical protein